MSKAELAHNKAVRGSYKGHCTQDIKRAERLMADTDTPNITELKAITERLTRRLDEISLMDNKIISALDKEEEIIHETDEALTFQDNILYWNLQITEFIAGRQLPVSPLHDTNVEESKPAFRAHINLPKLQIITNHYKSLQTI